MEALKYQTLNLYWNIQKIFRTCQQNCFSFLFSFNFLVHLVIVVLKNCEWLSLWLWKISSTDGSVILQVSRVCLWFAKVPRWVLRCAAYGVVRVETGHLCSAWMHGWIAFVVTNGSTMRTPGVLLVTFEQLTPWTIFYLAYLSQAPLLIKVLKLMSWCSSGYYIYFYSYTCYLCEGVYSFLFFRFETCYSIFSLTLIHCPVAQPMQNTERNGKWVSGLLAQPHPCEWNG